MSSFYVLYITQAVGATNIRILISAVSDIKCVLLKKIMNDNQN